ARGAARLAAPRFRSARLIVTLTHSAADSAQRARVLAPAVRRLHRAPGRSSGVNEPDIRAASDTKDAAAAKALALDLQNRLAVDIDRAAALLTVDWRPLLPISYQPARFSYQPARCRIRTLRARDRATHVSARLNARSAVD